MGKYLRLGAVIHVIGFCPIQRGLYSVADVFVYVNSYFTYNRVRRLSLIFTYMVCFGRPQRMLSLINLPVSIQRLQFLPN